MMLGNLSQRHENADGASETGQDLDDPTGGRLFSQNFSIVCQKKKHKRCLCWGRYRLEAPKSIHLSKSALHYYCSSGSFVLSCSIETTVGSVSTTMLEVPSILFNPPSPPGAPEGLCPGSIEGADRAVTVSIEDEAGGPIGLLRNCLILLVFLQCSLIPSL